MTETYEERLAARVAQWSEKHPEKAAALRLATRRKFGKLQEPPAGGLRAMVLEIHYREAVRVACKWPTEAEWTEKERLTAVAR